MGISFETHYLDLFKPLYWFQIHYEVYSIRLNWIVTEKQIPRFGASWPGNLPLTGRPIEYATRLDWAPEVVLQTSDWAPGGLQVYPSTGLVLGLNELF